MRIMTIHKSKGLEFPVVIVAGLGSKFNMQDASQDLLMHRELGLGLYRTEREKSLRYSTFAREAVAERIKRESKAEELRVLYVAMTRAREKLILVGSTKKLAACAEGWCTFVTQTERALPAHAALAANSFLDWLGMTVARHADGAPLREKAALLEKRVAPEGEDESRWQVEIVPASAVASVSAAVAEDDELFEKLRRGEPLEASEEKDDVEQMLAWQYAPHGVDNVPAKLSVTELKRRFSVEDAAEEKAYTPLKEVHGSSKNVFKRPDFMQEKAGLSAAEYGTLMHAVLQHIDLAGDTGREGLEKQLANMMEKELLLPEQAKAVRLDAAGASFPSAAASKRTASILKLSPRRESSSRASSTCSLKTKPAHSCSWTTRRTRTRVPQPCERSTACRSRSTRKPWKRSWAARWRNAASICCRTAVSCSCREENGCQYEKKLIQ